jgi:hypothetical protein
VGTYNFIEDVPGLTKELTFANPEDITELQADPDLWPNDPDAPAENLQDVGFIYLVAPSEAGTNPDVPEPPHSDDDYSWIQLRVQQPGSGDDPVASIEAIQIAMPDTGIVNEESDPGRIIVREIRIEDASYREDRLLSLTERLSYREDDSFPGGRRPSRGVAVLFRQTLDGRNQLMTLPYTLEPLGRVSFDEDTELPFVPPETFDRLYSTSNDSAEYGLLQQVELELGYDPATMRYTLTAPDAADNWAIQKDQRLVVSTGDPSGMGTPPRTNPVVADRSADLMSPMPGADAAVRVLFTRPDPNNSNLLQAVINDAPRTSPPRGGPRAMLDVLDGTERATVWAWALRPVVRSDEGGDVETEWRVRPTGSQVITLGGAQ